MYFNGICIGTIEEEDRDFPNLWGTYTLDESFELSNDTKIKRIKNYIELSMLESELIDKDHLMDLTREFDNLNEKFEPIMDIIDSEDWVFN